MRPPHSHALLDAVGHGHKDHHEKRLRNDIKEKSDVVTVGGRPGWRQVMYKVLTKKGCPGGLFE